MKNKISNDETYGKRSQGYPFDLTEDNQVVHNGCGLEPNPALEYLKMFKQSISYVPVIHKLIYYQ